MKHLTDPIEKFPKDLLVGDLILDIFENRLVVGPDLPCLITSVMSATAGAMLGRYLDLLHSNGCIQKNFYMGSRECLLVIRKDV